MANFVYDRLAKQKVNFVKEVKCIKINQKIMIYLYTFISKESAVFEISVCIFSIVKSIRNFILHFPPL